jgi:hypothetical protein
MVHLLPLHVFLRQCRGQRQDGRLESAFSAEDGQKRTGNERFGRENVAIVSWRCVSTPSPYHVLKYTPATNAHTTRNSLGIRLHRSTTLMPNFCAMKLNGIVTKKSSINISNTKSQHISFHEPQTISVVSMIPCSQASLLCTSSILHSFSGIASRRP